MRTHEIVVTMAVGVWLVVAGAVQAQDAEPTKQILSSDVRLRTAAVTRLVLDRDPATSAALRAALSDRDPIVRRLAIYGLGRIGGPAAAGAILPLLEDGDLWVRRTAVCALGKLRNRVATQALCEALQADDVHLRCDAFLALGRIGDPSSQKAVLEAMRDQRLWTELGVWDQVAVMNTVDRDWWTDRGAIEVLKWLLAYAEWDHPELADLEPVRQDRFTLMISYRAAAILARKFGDASGEELLIEALRKGLEWPDDYMHQGSAQALAALGSTQAVPALIGGLESEWLANKQYCIEALGESGDARATPALEELVGHEDIRVRRAAADALEKIDGRAREVAPAGPAAAIPSIPAAELMTPGGKRPAQFIVLGVDDCVNIEGIESMLDIVETLREHGRKVVFTMWVAPLAGEPESRDMVKQKLIYQRLFDLGSEVAHHTLHHNPGGRNWGSLPREQQIEEIEGCTQWYRDNIAGFTRPFSHKGGGGGRGARIDPEFTRELIRKQNFLYGGRRGQHPDDQMWPERDRIPYAISTGALDGNAPPVHAEITRRIRSDYGGQFDYDVAEGAAMMVANLDYRYNHPRRPILAVNAFHDWGFKTLDDSTCSYSHRNQAAILKAFLLDVLVENKDKYPDLHCVTFRQVVEYVRTDGDLEQTLAIGNGQDGRNPVKPSIE